MDYCCVPDSYGRAAVIVMLRLDTRPTTNTIECKLVVPGAETGGRAGAWLPYGSQIYIEYLNFD